MSRAFLASLCAAAAFGPLAWVGAAAAFATLACVGPRQLRPPPETYASVLGERLLRLEAGASREQAREQIGPARVHVPDKTDETFDTPLRDLVLDTPDGRHVEIDLYVVVAVRAQGCPDVQIALAPVAYVGGRVVATDWDYVESNWRGWGGELSALREARATQTCSEAAPKP